MRQREAELDRSFHLRMEEETTRLTTLHKTLTSNVGLLFSPGGQFEPQHHPFCTLPVPVRVRPLATGAHVAQCMPSRTVSPSRATRPSPDHCDVPSQNNGDFELLRSRIAAAEAELDALNSRIEARRNDAEAQMASQRAQARHSFGPCCHWTSSLRACVDLPCGFGIHNVCIEHIKSSAIWRMLCHDVCFA